MAGAVSTSGNLLQSRIAQEGFAFVQSGEMQRLLTRSGSRSDWAAFADSWNRLDLDTYMADGGRYRRRRHAVYTAKPSGKFVRQPHQPHYQAIDYNRLNGGIARWFEPIEPAIGNGSSMETILTCCRSLFGSLSPTVRDWHIQAHQFRIEARPGEPGLPSPEGVHRDGVDYVLVLLIERRNIKSGVTTIHGLNGAQLGHFTLTDPCDAALVDDGRVAHGVTAVEPIDPASPAHRDVLVVTFLAAPSM